MLSQLWLEQLLDMLHVRHLLGGQRERPPGLWVLDE